MAKRWTKKEVIELLDTMSLEELEILWRELRRCWAPTGARFGGGEVKEPLKAPSFKSPSHLPIAPTPTKD